MEYRKDFIELINSLKNEDNKNLRFVGLGNPNSKILIIGKECSFNLDKEQDRFLYKLENQDNLQQWIYNIENEIGLETLSYWENHPNLYNPLHPYKGQYNKVIRNNNDGTSETWVKYQKLIDQILQKNKPERIDFHKYAFITELSNIVMPSSRKSEETKESINIRCKKLFSHNFFKSFPVVIIHCGHYIRNYKINLEETFNQKFQRTDDDGDWINVHINGDRILLHTRHLSMCSDKLIERIAGNIRHCPKTCVNGNRIQL